MGDTRAQAIRITGTGREPRATKKGGTPQGGRFGVRVALAGFATNPALQQTACRPDGGRGGFRQIEAAGGVTTSVVTLVTALVPDFSTDLARRPRDLQSLRLA